MCAGVRGSSALTHVANVRSCEQDLRDRLVELSKEIVPERNELALPNSRQRLLATEPLPAVLQAHVTEADADSARRHEHDLVPERAQLDDRLDNARQQLEAWGIWGLCGDDRRGAFGSEGGWVVGAPSLMTMVIDWALNLEPLPLSGEDGRVFG